MLPLAASVILLLAVAPRSHAGMDLVLNARPLKLEYCFGEPIIVELELSNRGTAPTVVDRIALSQSGWLQALKADAPTETPMIHQWTSDGTVADDRSRFALLQSGASVRREIDLGTVAPLLKAGAYLLRTRYSSALPERVDGTPAFAGSIDSDTVYFVVRVCPDQQVAPRPSSP